MNFAINGSCSKGCSFCFTKEDYRLKHTLGEMSIEMVDKLITHYALQNSREEITILGGEPTQHSNFIELIDFIFSKNLKINLVSNLLFGNNIKEYLVKNIQNIKWILPNGAELDEKNRLPTFKKNYLELHSAYQKIWGAEKNSRLKIAITISSDWKERDLYEYIKWLYLELNGKLDAIRLGLDLTGTYLLNNKELGREITKILKFAKYNNIIITSDCQVLPCLWEGNTKETVYENSLGFATFKMANYDTICGYMPLDVFPDGSSIHCYPLQDKVKIDNVFNIIGENKIQSLSNTFDDLYIENYNNYNLPDICKNCIFYPNDCNGICGGCLEGK
jgi:organic radical activating enzyme